jgi:hypothetical protein
MPANFWSASTLKARDQFSEYKSAVIAGEVLARFFTGYEIKTDGAETAKVMYVV